MNPQPNDPTDNCEHLRGGLGHSTLHVQPSLPLVTTIIRRAIEDKQVWARHQLAHLVFRETGVWVKPSVISKAINRVDPIRGARGQSLHQVPFKGNAAHLKPAKEPRRARRNTPTNRPTADRTSGVSGRTAQSGSGAAHHGPPTTRTQ